MTAIPAAVPALHAAWGGLLVCAPAQLTRLAGEVPSPSSRRVLRLLGARHLGQAAVTAARPGPAALRAGGVVDIVHAASCAGLALVDARWRRAAALGCSGAIALAAAGFAAASWTEESAGGHPPASAGIAPPGADNSHRMWPAGESPGQVPSCRRCPVPILERLIRPVPWTQKPG